MQIINFSKKSDENDDNISMKHETIPLVRRSERLEKSTEVPEEEIPARPKKSACTAEYPRLGAVYVKLQQQNRAISQKEQNLGNLEMELQDCKGIFKGKRRKGLQGEIEQTKKQLDSMKQRLTDIVTSYGYQNVGTFLVDYEKSKEAYVCYKQTVDDWKQTYDKQREDQPKSIRARLKQHEEQIRQRERNRSPVQRKDRGAR